MGPAAAALPRARARERLDARRPLGDPTRAPAGVSAKPRPRRDRRRTGARSVEGHAEVRSRRHAEGRAAASSSPAPDATNCDFDKNGRIDRSRRATPRSAAPTACTADPECTEYSNYAARSTFRLTVTDANGAARAIQADATASAEFNPLALKGQELRAFTGTLHFFSGGSQFTIEARCKDDIVIDLNAQPLPSDKACVFPRTVLEREPAVAGRVLVVSLSQ